MLLILTFFYESGFSRSIQIYLISIVTFRFISRIIEIVLAFGIDVMPESSQKGSGLKLINRIELAISSIVEILLLNLAAYLLFPTYQYNVINVLIAALTGDSLNCSSITNNYLISLTIISRLAILFICSFVILEYIKHWHEKK